MVIASKLDEYGKPAWIAATVLAFWWFWPVGLAMVAFMAGSGRLKAWRREGPGRWYNTANATVGSAAAGCGWGRRNARPQSGNAAFDDYRAETLRRLEDEQKEFMEYLERLRRAKDKAEFDQFMEERRRPPTTTEN